MLSNLIELANSLGDHWAVWMAATLLDSLALLAVIGLVWFAIRRRVAPQVGYCLFLLVPLRLLSPLEVAVPPSVAKWTPSKVLVALIARSDRAATNNSGQSVAVQDQAGSARSEFRPPSLQHKTQAADEFGATARPPRATTPAVAAVPAVAEVTLRWPAIGMVTWLTAVMLWAGRFTWTQLGFRKRLRVASPVDESQLSVDFGELCVRAGVSRTVRFVESNRVMAPAVWGLLRPTIILPCGIAASLTAKQLRWVLLHELAHVRRRDLLVIIVQRFAAILNFCNPAVWIANRIANRLREYACDDFATLLSEGSGVESGEAFVQVLRNEQRAHRKLEGALGMFGLDSRAACVHRVRRMLDLERPIKTRLGRLSLAGLIVLAVVSLPHLRAATEQTNSDLQAAKDDTPKGPADKNGDSALPAANATANSAPGKNEQMFELTVVGPDHKPLAGIVVECRGLPDLMAEQIQSGEFVRKASYGLLIKLNASGKLALKLPKDMKSFDIFIEAPGYGPYWAGWNSESHPQPIPSTLTAELDAAWSAGGIVVDGDGKPVKGVTLQPSIEFKKRPGNASQMEIGTQLTTDAEGKWHFDSVPTSMTEVAAEINHPNFMPVWRTLTRAEFGIERGAAPVSTIILKPGLTVTGKVTDESGKPIAGARIRGKFLNDIREATTGDDGMYRLIGCDRITARLVVSAKGRATDMQELRVEPDMKPVNFQMKPGGTIRIRVVNAHDQPVAKARIFLQWWRGHCEYFEFGHKSDYADEHGVWDWKEAPLDEFKADIGAPDGAMNLSQQSLIARKDEYVFKLPPDLVISGKVVDAETKKPIERFQVLPGVRSSKSQMNWVHQKSFAATGGQFQLRPTHDYFAQLVRIEADGYLPVVSRDIKSNEGNVSIDFALKKGKNIVATVLTPNGAPAARARVALGVVGSQINVTNGDIADSQTYAARQTTDDKGRFDFPPQDGPFQLVIAHPTGFAHVKLSVSPEKPTTIYLEPWARVEGTFRVGKTPTPNVPLTINSNVHDEHGDGVPHIFSQHEATTGPDGRFVFERVIPGDGQIGRYIMLTVNDGAAAVTSTCMTSTSFRSGRTLRIDLGGTGRIVAGRLQPPEGIKDRIPWNFAVVTAETDWYPLPRFMATVDRDGAFRIDDMLAGEYTLGVSFSQHDVGSLSNYRFTVPAKEYDQPLDLGVLKLK